MLYKEVLEAWALAYGKIGWCVLPAKNKHPVGDWKAYQQKLPTAEQLADWFSDVPEDAQIALITGKISGVSVLDIDCHKRGCPSKKGQICTCNPTSPEELRAKFPVTLTSKTGSGGYHLFFKYEEKLRNSVGLLHPQLDIRSDGGIIILPPSVYKADETPRREYAWDEFVPWNLANLRNLPPFPPVLLSSLRTKEKTDWKGILSGRGLGGRNDAAAKLIGKMIIPFEESEFWALYEFIQAWNTKNDPPLPEEELRRTFISIGTAELARRNAPIKYQRYARRK